MAQQQPIRTGPDRGLIITEEMVIERFMRTLMVFGREFAIELFTHYDRIFSGFSGWEVTRRKLEDFLLNYDRERLKLVSGGCLEIRRGTGKGILLGEVILTKTLPNHYQSVTSYV